MMTIHILITILSIIILVKLRQNYNDIEDIKSIISPIYIINISLVLRNIIYGIDYGYWIYTKGKKSIVDFYELMLWIYMVYQIVRIIERQDIIQIASIRRSRMNKVLFYIKLAMVIGIVINVLNSFIYTSAVFGFFTIALLCLIAISILYLLNREKINTGSKIVKLRWEFLIQFWIFFIIFIASYVLGFGIADVLYPNGYINAGFYAFFITIMTITPGIMSVMSYYIIFIPEWARRRSGLANPKQFLN